MKKYQRKRTNQGKRSGTKGGYFDPLELVQISESSREKLKPRGFNGTFHDPYLVLRILSFLDFPFLRRYNVSRHVPCDSMRYSGYGRFIGTKKIWWLFSSVCVDYNRFVSDKKSFPFIDIRYVENLEVRKVELKSLMGKIFRSWMNALHRVRKLKLVNTKFHEYASGSEEENNFKYLEKLKMKNLTHLVIIQPNIYSTTRHSLYKLSVDVNSELLLRLKILWLESLKLENNLFFNPNGFDNLEDLTLINCDCESYDLKYLHRLRMLRIENHQLQKTSTHDDNKIIMKLIDFGTAIQKMKNLRSLRLHGISPLDCQSWGRGNDTLRMISITCILSNLISFPIHSMTRGGLQKLILELDSDKLDTWTKSVKKQSLKSIKIHHLDLTIKNDIETFLFSGLKFPNLKELIIRYHHGNKNVRNRYLRRKRTKKNENRVNNFPNLRTLKLFHCRSCSFLRSLHTCKKIASVVLNNTKDISSWQSFLSHTNVLNSLGSLELRSLEEFDDTFFRNIRFKCLQRLKIRDCDSLTSKNWDRSVTHNLTLFKVSYCNSFQDWLFRRSNLPKIRRIELKSLPSLTCTKWIRFQNINNLKKNSVLLLIQNCNNLASNIKRRTGERIDRGMVEEEITRLRSLSFSKIFESYYRKGGEYYSTSRDEYQRVHLDFVEMKFKYEYRKSSHSGDFSDYDDEEMSYTAETPSGKKMEILRLEERKYLIFCPLEKIKFVHTEFRHHKIERKYDVDEEKSIPAVHHQYILTKKKNGGMLLECISAVPEKGLKESVEKFTMFIDAKRIDELIESQRKLDLKYRDLDRRRCNQQVEDEGEVEKQVIKKEEEEKQPKVNLKKKKKKVLKKRVKGKRCLVCKSKKAVIRCSVCNKVIYCSRSCKLKDYVNHVSTCSRQWV